MTDLALRPTAFVPTNEWVVMVKQAEYLASSDIIPTAYRRKPANIMVAALTGRAHGWDVMTAMRNGHVVEGTWGLRPEAMLGLVRSRGHKVGIDLRADRAVVCGERCDNGDTMTVVFSFEDAAIAGLCTIKDGRPYARSQNGKRLPWEQYPKTMCQWRAVALLCRTLFSDVTLGVHSVEELGATIDQDGEVVEQLGEVEHTPAHQPVALGAEAMGRFVEACEAEGLDPSEVMRRAFPDHEPDDPVLDTELPHLRDVFRAMIDEHAVEHPPAVVDVPGPDNFVSDEIAEGVVVPDDPAPPSTNEVRPATRAQVGKIKAEWERLGVADRDVQLSYVLTLLGVEVASHNALSTDQASELIEYLVDTDHLDL